MERIAVTAFADYLASPFHFWANRLRRLNEIDPAKAEMDDLDFGNFCHLVLEAFGRDESARNLTDGESIEDWFLDAADRFAFEQFGARPGLAVRIQLQSAKARLRSAARLQAAERAAGWEIIAVERSLADAYPLEISGLRISGKIDRVERNGDRYRVLDYKTSDSPPKGGAKSDHCVNNRLSDDIDWPPDYAFFEREEKPMRWKKLQLPLYSLALVQHLPDAELTAGYFHLAKAATDVAIDAWEMDPEWLEAAHTCAEGVIADVLAGKFAHLVSRGDRDGLASWHLGLPEKTLDLTFVGGDASPVP
ncbi:MAG: PD-(D/E)XK nuclease family protein [Verrucomicrobiae bacterium]|nr:PD-(D/E)XK nuclease family protein [Verrucomicrobiae bacterium]